jgi:hypothetical protein
MMSDLLKGTVSRDFGTLSLDRFEGRNMAGSGLFNDVFMFKF